MGETVGMDGMEGGGDTLVLDENGLNARIGLHALPDADMLALGFRDCGDRWYCVRAVGLASGCHWLTLNVTVPKDGARGRIDVLDECFCQPYDYQRILMDDPRNGCASAVRDDVEREMARLADAGVVSGHVPGEYV